MRCAKLISPPPAAAARSRRLAEPVAARTRDHLHAAAREMIERTDMFFLATCDHRGLPTCSYKEGDPGLVRVLNASWLALCNYDGNGKYQSLGKLRKNPRVGMLFVDLT